MKTLDVIVKEPLQRNPSFDDFNLCFENFNKKAGTFSFGDLLHKLEVSTTQKGEALFANNPKLIKAQPRASEVIRKETR